MPREVRNIILNEPELVGAINSFRRVRKDLLPPGTVTGVKGKQGGDALVSMEMRFGPNIREDSFVLESQHVLEAMIRFCLENNIMVPRGGRKGVARAGEDWVLEIRLKDGEMAHHVAAGDRQEVSIGVRTAISVATED